MFIPDVQKIRKPSRSSFLATLFQRSSKTKFRSVVILELLQGEARAMIVVAGQPKAMERIDMPPEVMQKNEIQDIDAAAFFIRQLTKKFPTISQVVAIIPEEEVFRRFLQVAQKDDERTILARILPDILPATPEEMFWEWRIVRPLTATTGHKDIEVIAVSRQYLLNYYDTLRLAKLQPVNFLPESFGILKLIFPVLESQNANLVVFSDKSRTILMVFAGHAIHVTSVLAYGERELVGEAIGVVIEEINRVIQFYRHRVVHEHGASPDVDRIIIFGDIDEGVKNLIALNTQLRPEFFNIWAGGVATDFVPLIGWAKTLLE